MKAKKIFWMVLAIILFLGGTGLLLWKYWDLVLFLVLILCSGFCYNKKRYGKWLL